MNLGFLLNRAALWYQVNTAVLHRGEAFTYREINQNSDRLANGLLKLGLKKGDRLVIVASDCTQYIEADFAIYKSGLIRVAINPRLSLKEIEFISKNAEASAILFTDDMTESINRIRPQLSDVKHFICLTGNVEGCVSYQDLIKDSMDVPPDIEVNEDDTAMLFYTGGTTGTPKGAILTHRAVKVVALNFITAYAITQQDVFLSSATIAHATGFRIMASYLGGAKYIMQDKFDPKLVMETVEEEKVTILSTVPTTLIRLCNYPEINSYDFRSLRMVTFGAAPIAVDKLKQAIRVFGPRLANVYGQAEAPCTIAYLSPREIVLNGEKKAEKRLASVGRPFLNVEVRVVGNDGKDVKPGEIGEITVRSEHVMKGYWQKPEATAEALKDGWLHTGDLGMMDEDGYVFLIDRKKDIIISGGYNIYAREVEEVLNNHEAVAEAAVFGIPDPEWGESVKAVVALKPGVQATENELTEFCRKSLASYKKPKSIDFLSELPKSSLGKIAKKELKDKYWQGYNRRI